MTRDQFVAQMRRYWRAKTLSWLKPKAEQPTRGMGFGRQTFAPPQTAWWQQLTKLRTGLAVALVLGSTAANAGNYDPGNSGSGFSSANYRGKEPTEFSGGVSPQRTYEFQSSIISYRDNPNRGVGGFVDSMYRGMQRAGSWISSSFSWQRGWYGYDQSHENPGGFRAEPGPSGY